MAGRTKMQVFNCELNSANVMSIYSTKLAFQIPLNIISI